ncbi:Fc.00g021740.m01.CDS01 [Cosmosporella sp. VM-42]
MEAHHEKPAGDHVLKTPIWMVVIRGFQVFISLIILALCGRLMHDAYLDEEGFSLAISLFTWLAVAYILLTEKISGLRNAYNVIAVLVIDGLLMILWLAAFAATAARRAKYVYDVSVGDCSDNGSLIDSKSCSVFGKRAVILFKSGMAMLAAVAGLGALVWLLFIASFVWTLMMFLRGRKEGRFGFKPASASTPTQNYQMENKISEAQPMSPQTYPSQTQPGQFAPVQQPQFVQPDNGQQYQQPPPTQSPYQNTGPYQAPQQGYPPQQQQQFQGQQNFQQQPIQPHMTGQNYTNDLPAQNQYGTPPPQAVSPPPHQYQQSPPPQQYQQNQQYPPQQ